MALNLLYFLIFTAFLSQGHSLTMVQLPDHTLTYETNPLLGSSIGISKNLWDTLELCLATLPDGETYEAYPKNNIPSPYNFEYAVQPFTSCVIGFRGISVEHGGTFELGSLVRHSGNNSQTLTTRRFHLTVIERET